jgi:epoxide hydrolase
MIEPFRVDFPAAQLDDLAERLRRARFVPELPGGGDRDLGVPTERVRRLVDHWRHGYDWRAWEAALNRHPQHRTRIDGLWVHFLHVRSPRPDALPLVLTHGWPMSVFEYLDLIDRLRGDFHLVVPSLPGFGLSDPPAEAGWGRTRIAGAWAELMHRLGYDRYGAHGNDVGSPISLELGRLDPDHVTGVHVTQVFSLPSGDPGELTGLDEADADRLCGSQAYIRDKGAYLQLQATQPRTLAHALGDSPVGQLAWNLQVFDDTVDPDYILTNTTLRWLTNSAGSSALAGYAEDARGRRPAAPTTFPLGVSTFAGDAFLSVRSLAARDHARIVRWTDHPTGGHHPAHQVPDLLAADLRAFYGQLS